MTKSILQVGDSIKNINPYEGEGELIICELGEKQIKCIHACHTKYQNLNGMVENKCYEDLQYYEKLKT